MTPATWASARDSPGPVPLPAIGDASGILTPEPEVSVQIELIDGTFELWRSYSVIPSSTAPDGTEVGATKGVVRTLCKLLREEAPTHLGFSFDLVIESFRNDLFDGYKTGDGIDPALGNQFELVCDAAEALGIVTWRNVRYEADDAIATMAVRAAADPRVTRVRMRSPDKDLAQVVQGERVVMFDAIRERTTDEAGVLERFGVQPSSIPDYLALVGDAADGIPGIPRWGAKSTSTVLRRYGHVAAIPPDGADWDVKVRGAKGLSENLEAERDAARLYVDLATLRTDVPLVVEGVDDLEWRGAWRDRFEALAERLGDPGLARFVPRWREV